MKGEEGEEKKSNLGGNAVPLRHGASLPGDCLALAVIENLPLALCVQMGVNHIKTHAATFFLLLWSVGAHVDLLHLQGSEESPFLFHIFQELDELTCFNTTLPPSAFCSFATRGQISSAFPAL